MKKEEESSEEAKVVTLTFKGEDIELYTALAEDAANDERSISKYLLRFIRLQYDQAKHDSTN